MAERVPQRDPHVAQPPERIVSAPLAAGDYEVRLARTEAEIRAAQALRYRTLFLERGGDPGEARTALGADADEWDGCALHVIVALRSDPSHVVGTLRLVANEDLAPGQRFYTEQAFDLSGLRARYARMLELGRFCIEADRRQGGILLLIWRWTMSFIVENRIEVMFGCVSFPGTDVESHRPILSYLYHHNLAPPALRPRPRAEDHVRLADFADEAPAFSKATRDLPTLLRGYLKLGAYASDAAIVDPEFNTTFVGLYVDAEEMLAGNTPLLGRRH